jgi:hypothetical protein
MSIILKALKRIQDQKADRPPGDPALEEAEHAPNAGIDAAIASITQAPTDKDQAAASRDMPVRQPFITGPRLLVAVVIVLGIFTTGWFTNKIYISLKAPSRGPKAVSKAVTRPAPSASAATAQAVEPVPTPTTMPAQAPAPEPESATAAPATVEPAEIARAAVAPAARQEPPPAASAPARVSAPPPAPPPAPKPAAQAEKETKPLKNGRPDFKINAIAWKADEPKAIVNMQRVYEGDVIEGATVVTIQRKSILFEYNGETFEVRF